LLVKLGFLMLTFKDYFPLFLLQIVYIATQIFDRCMNAIRDPARDAILMENSTPETRGICFGLRKFITSFGSILSGCLAGLLIFLWQRGYSNVTLFKYVLLPPIGIMICAIAYITRKKILLVIFFFIMLLLNYLASKIVFSSLLYMISILPVILAIFVVVYKIKEPKKEILPTKELLKFSLFRQNFQKTKSIFILLTLMCLLSLGKLTDYCIFMRGMELGMSKYWIPFMFTIIYICITLFSYLFGLMVDRKRNFLTLLISVLSILAGNYLLALPNSFLSFWLGLILNSIYLAASDSAFASIITFFMPSNDIKATVYGILYGLSGFIGLLNSFIVVFLQRSAYSLQSIYSFSCIPLLVALLVLIRNYKEFKQKNNN
jgi:MFS family permease